MTDHTNKNAIAEILVTIVKALMMLGDDDAIVYPIKIHRQEKNRALAGTWYLESLPRSGGAPFCVASPYIMRLVEKIPLFAEEAAEVRTTKLTKPAAIGMPASQNMETKGLCSGTI